MRVNELPSADILRQLLECDPSTGMLRWRPRSVEWFKETDRHGGAANACAVWNARYAGRQAFIQTGPGGYLRGKLLGRLFFAHRIIWKYATGNDAEFVDHINGDKADNRLVNLRSVSRQENARNRPRPKNNKSGIAGVHWCNTRKVWTTQISVGGKQRQIGWFKNKDDAIACRIEALRQCGFHENHGRC